MSIKTKDYLKGFIILLIMVLLIFILDLPKTTLIVIGFTIPFVVIMHELFSSPKEKDLTRKREYITSILFFIIFAVLIFIFDLPKKLYIFIGIMPISSIILYELFNINKKN